MQRSFCDSAEAHGYCAFVDIVALFYKDATNEMYSFLFKEICVKRNEKHSVNIASKKLSQG